MHNKPRKKIKILFAIAKLGVGGAEKMVVNQINSIDKTVFEPYLLTLLPEPDISFLQDVHIPKEHIKFFNFPSYFQVISWLKLIVWMRKESFDIVFCNLILANTIVRIASYVSGTRNIIVVEHNLYPKRKKIKFVVSKILSFLTRRILAVSYDVKNFFVKKSILSSKIDVLYNGIEIDEFRMRPGAKKDIRKELNMGDKEVIILSVGNVSTQKAYDVLIDTALKLSDTTRYTFRFIVAGDSDSLLAKELKRQVIERGLGSIVEFLGTRKDVPNLMAASDIFFMPSRWEGFGLVLVEAMAAGLPFVANSVGVVSDDDREVNGIKSGVHGYVVHGCSAEGFGEVLVKLVENLSLRKKLGFASRDKARDFSIQKNIEGLESVCLDILSMGNFF